MKRVIYYNILYHSAKLNKTHEDVSSKDFKSLTVKYLKYMEIISDIEVYIDKFAIDKIYHKYINIVFKNNTRHLIIQIIPEVNDEVNEDNAINKYRDEEPTKRLLPIAKELADNIINSDTYKLPKYIFLEHWNQLLIPFNP